MGIGRELGSGGGVDVTLLEPGAVLRKDTQTSRPLILRQRKSASVEGVWDSRRVCLFVTGRDCSLCVLMGEIRGEGKIDEAGEGIITGAKSLRGAGFQGPAEGLDSTGRTGNSSSESGQGRWPL